LGCVCLIYKLTNLLRSIQTQTPPIMKPCPKCTINSKVELDGDPENKRKPIKRKKLLGNKLQL
jgi:hypothetical protein